MTITEKILLKSTNLKEIKPGDLIESKIDLILANDITAPLAIEEFSKTGINKVFNKEKISLVCDHFTPNKDIKSANQCRKIQKFVKKYKIKYYFGQGEGIEHALLPEQGLISPGNVVIGADSHTCTYGALGCFSTGVGSTDIAYSLATGKLWFKVPHSIKFIFYGKIKKWISGKDLILYTISKIGVNGALYSAMEFSGEVIKNLSIDDRFTICNMAIEAGAKSGIMEVDEKTEEYLKNVKAKKGEIFNSDKHAKYKKIYEFDVSKIEPQVAFPSLPSNCKPISKVGKIYLDQVVIGSCTNGRISDLRIAAKILKNKKVYKDLRLIIIPATRKVYKQALDEGLINIFINSGAIVSPPTCGPCLGGHMGVLAKSEKCLSTTNRNFLGRMGDKDSEVYLCSPAVAAASAIKGRIIHPEEITK